MSLCLTFFNRGLDADILRNHAHYCQIYGYTHKWVEAGHIAHAALRTSYKYSQILHHLRQLSEGDWLFFIDDNSVIFHAVAIEALLEGRDLVVVDGPVEDNHPGRALTNMILLRNTAANRALLHQMVTASCHVITGATTHLDENAHFGPAGMLGCNGFLAEIYVNVTWRTVGWFNANIFVVCLGPLPLAGPGGEPKEYMLHDLNLQAYLVRQTHRALLRGGPALEAANYPALSEQSTSCHNPGHRIAFVTLYGHDIHSYARVAEHNIKRYCERHGYTYHVYRGLPQALVDTGMNGTWAKTWLLREHFADYDWVIWVDADVVFLNQTKPIEPLLDGRDLLLAKDIGGWAVNAGVLGFRQTPRNAQLLARIWERIVEVEDKSGVYTGQGDQYYINVILTEEGLIGEESVLENLSINTPPHLMTHESLLVHFVNLGEPYRSAYMAEVDAQSLRLG